MIQRGFSVAAMARAYGDDLRGRVLDAAAEGASARASAVRFGVGVSTTIAHATEQDRPEVLRRRRAWFERQLDLDPARLVFVNETGLSTKMAGLRGRAPRGERCKLA